MILINMFFQLEVMNDSNILKKLDLKLEEKKEHK
jgi:hypothetical protein